MYFVVLKCISVSHRLRGGHSQLVWRARRPYVISELTAEVIPKSERGFVLLRILMLLLSPKL